MTAIDYLKAYGIINKSGDLFYKKLSNGCYLVAFESCNDIDLFLCKWLPEEHDEITSDCYIDKILSFDNNYKDKVDQFKTMLSF